MVKGTLYANRIFWYAKRLSSATWAIAYPPVPWATVTDKENIMKKNWSAIAVVGNEQLRHNLIAATGEVAQGLAQGFPQYFLGDGEPHPQPNRDDFVRLVSEIKRRDDVIQACKDAGLPFQRFGFSGSCKGSTDGVSYAKGGYNTTANGWGDYFYRSSKKRGETLEYEGAEWLVVWNGYSSGDAYSFSGHSLVVVPVTALIG